MIEVIGVSGSSEYDAAIKLQHAFIDLLGMDLIERSDIKLLVGAKTFGERRQDIDIVAVGNLSSGFKLPKIGAIKKEAFLKSFFLTIEVKDHSPERIEFVGQKVFVKYKDGREDATEQAEQQKYSCISYIKKNNVQPPYVTSVVLLNNALTEFLPANIINVLGADFGECELAELIYKSYERNITDKHRLIEAFNQRYGSNYVQVVDLLAKKLVTTKLDRAKIDLISKRDFDQKYANDRLGSQLLIFSGPGGTGKTVNLLQLAHYVYKKKDAKALILTYNLALVSDIRRLLAMMNIGDDIAAPTVKIATVHSFLYWLFVDAHLMARGSPRFLKEYDSLKAQFINLIAQGGHKGVCEHWDYVFIDEGQDWPEDERDILYGLYGPASCVVADGRSQLIRTSHHCGWNKNNSIKSQTVSLSKSLRLKHDISVFVARIIEFLSVPDWRTEPNLTVHGGRVVVYIGDMTNDIKFIRSCVNSAVADGNEVVDLCMCFPPSMVDARAKIDEKGRSIKERYFPFGLELESHGFHVWDGADQRNRASFPLLVDQLRLVQYDSCRGLEGWTVFNFCIDELFDYKVDSFDAASGLPSDFFVSDEEAALRFAKRWVAIPLTRAIDTLVVNIRNPSHLLVNVFKRAASGMSAVEIIEGKV